MEEEEPTKGYIRGFNKGYLLAKLEPELMDLILASQPEDIKNDFVTALVQGKKQYDLEQAVIQAELNEWEDKLRINPKKDDKELRTDHDR
ncbi:hypothetical protein [Dyadobacter sp. CY323]|uniref:hypothetical protein n=1 Tax=Dyadobacter sp. CY323 TaxID=2907302 RepID=UPI001F254884|nr:hypothetical protein [Dyadobacter sp. CY323]MCE6989000.1 hypothetical protein [Dyadobacter sp. CY323]